MDRMSRLKIGGKSMEDRERRLDNDGWRMKYKKLRYSLGGGQRTHMIWGS